MKQHFLKCSKNTLTNEVLLHIIVLAKQKYYIEEKKKMKNGKSKMFVLNRGLLILSVCLIFCALFSFESEATNKTQAEAISWVQSQVGKSIDTDGYPSGQPYQCVDLIKAYYSYLGVSPANGNGSDYTWNTLPSGWSRIQGAQPQKGDILVYTGGYNNYGHVAIYESDRAHYHQNADNCYYVKKSTYMYNVLSTPYWGVIRPNFASSSSVDSYFTGLWHGEISNTNARIDATINLTYIQQCGFYYGTNISSMRRVVEDTYANTLNIWFNFNEYGITLSPGTTYYYKIFIVVNGTEYQTTTQSFATTGHSHSYSSSITTSPTCTENGVKTYICSCGNSYTESIAALGHNYSDEFTIDVAPTCNKIGSKSRHCTLCSATTDKTIIERSKYHLLGDYVTTKEPTCTEEGERKRSCIVCNRYSLRQRIEKIAHNYVSVVTEPTCMENGYTTYSCSMCGDSYNDNEIAAKGHNYSEWVTINNALCNTEGLAIISCRNCGMSESKILPATGHKDKDGDDYCDECDKNVLENGNDEDTSYDSNGSCLCSCHKSGLMGFIWKIIRFIYEIFGINKTCDCGINHY